jgi:hypothetical protein
MTSPGAPSASSDPQGAGIAGRFPGTRRTAQPPPGRCLSAHAAGAFHAPTTLAARTSNRVDPSARISTPRADRGLPADASAPPGTGVNHSAERDPRTTPATRVSFLASTSRIDGGTLDTIKRRWKGARTSKPRPCLAMESEAARLPRPHASVSPNTRPDRAISERRISHFYTAVTRHVPDLRKYASNATGSSAAALGIPPLAGVSRIGARGQAGGSASRCGERGKTHRLLLEGSAARKESGNDDVRWSYARGSGCFD